MLPSSRSTKIDYLSLLFYTLLAYGAVLLLPIFCVPIRQQLDPSWHFGLNYFIHSNLKFGPDFVFTYGPLGFLSKPAHIANNIPIALAVRFLIWGIGLWQLASLWRAGNRAGAIAILISMAAAHMLYRRQWEHLITTVILILMVRFLTGTGRRIELALLGPLTGVVFLNKFTSFATSLLALLAITIHLLLVDRKPRGRIDYLLIAIAWLGAPLAYLIYEPSPRHLLQYVWGGFQVASGYVVAMSLETQPESAWFALAICFVLLSATLLAFLTRSVHTLGAAAIALLTWAVFRQAHTRSDLLHEGPFYFFAPLLLAVLIALSQLRRRQGFIALALLGILLAVTLPQANRRFGFTLAETLTPQWNLVDGYSIFDWQRAMARLDSIAADALSKTPAVPYRPRLIGSRVMVFPWDLAYAANANIDLFPIYGMQGYQSNTQFLDRESAATLSRADPPVRYVVFEWKSIDGRHPVVDMPCFWAALFSQYYPAQILQDSALLERRPVPHPVSFVPLTNIGFQPGVWVDVPKRETPVAVSLALRPTLAGSVTAAVYKLPAVYLELMSRSGVVRRFRVPPDVLANPFPISSLPMNFQEAMDFWRELPTPNPVLRFRLVGDGLTYFAAPHWAFWDTRGMPTQATPAPLPSPAENVTTFSVDSIHSVLRGFIDFINAVHPQVLDDPAQPVELKSAEGAVLEGWVFSAQEADEIIMDEVFAVIHGKAVKAEIVKRPDVSQQLRNPKLLRCGFRIEIGADLIGESPTRVDIVGRTKYNGKLYRFPSAIYLRQR